MTAPLKVGDIVWIIRKDLRLGEPFQVEVTKVGRLYAHTNRGYRVKMDTKQVLGADFYVGQAWRCIDDYHAKVKLDKDWNEFSSMMRNKYTCPSHLTSADINELGQRIFPNGELIRME